MFMKIDYYVRVFMVRSVIVCKVTRIMLCLSLFSPLRATTGEQSRFNKQNHSIDEIECSAKSVEV